MNRDDLAAKVGGALGLQVKDGLQIVEVITDEITAMLKNGDWLEVRGFGTFKTVQRKTKPARVISTGERVIVPPRKVAKFIPGLSIKEELRKISERESSQQGISESKSDSSQLSSERE